MKDFASYEGKGDEDKRGGADWEAEVKKTASRYNGRNENDIVREIYALASAGKKNGTLTNEQIDAFYSQFAPMLDGAKRKRLQRLVEQLKKT